MPVPYLADPPAVIPIDVGRQLFVDDFLIETTALRRTFHQAEYCTENPVIRQGEPGGYKAPFSGGAFYDPADNRFKIWYTGGESTLWYATSADGIEWELDEFGIPPETPRELACLLSHPRGRCPLSKRRRRVCRWWELQRETRIGESRDGFPESSQRCVGWRQSYRDRYRR